MPEGFWDEASELSKQLEIKESGKTPKDFKETILQFVGDKITNNNLLNDYLDKKYQIYKQQGKISISIPGLMLHGMGITINKFKAENPKAAELTKAAYENIIEKPLDFTMEHVIKPIIEPIIKENQIIFDFPNFPIKSFYNCKYIKLQLGKV